LAKIITLDEAVEMIGDGSTVMFGGFMGCGAAQKTIQALANKGTKNIWAISNDAGMPDAYGHSYYGLAKMVHNHQISKLTGSHMGLNPEVAEQMNAGTLELELFPQGSFCEKIRAGGAGLGGVLTPTGFGTIVANDKQIVEVKGKKYLLEEPLRADFAIISGYKVDKRGNVWYRGTTRNFNQAMATAADVVIVEADNLVEVGQIEPENVHTQGLFVNYIIDGSRA
jgi:acetate CoA/acetoacetate CoA-transferase alpha subunit